MTSPPNLMEVISKGSIEMYASDHEQQPRHRPLSSSSSSHRESLQSLESLPPDEPSVVTSSSTFTATSDCSTETYSDSMTDSSSVYARIHQLADSVKREVTAMRSGAAEPEEEEISAKESIKPAQGDKKGQGSVIEERKKKGVEESDLEMAAKVKRALAKMRHLDSRLTDLCKKEKEVKRQRLALEQQSDVQSDSRSSSTLLPVESMVVFPTQPLYHSSGELHCVESQDSMISVQTEEVESTPDSKKETVKDHIVSDDRFIKRNIQLASDAGSLIAMTEEEKKRLEQLLTDNDEEEEMSENEEEGESHNMQLIPAAAGFTFSEDDMERLRDIDSQLQNIVPALQWPTTLSQNDLSSEQAESVSDGKLSPSTTTTTTTTQAGPGEAVLLMLQTDREASNRLHQIETMLNHLQANKDQHDTNSDPSHNIDHELLQELLKQCRDEQSSSQSSLHAHYHE